MSKRVLIVGHNILQPDMGGARLRRLARLLPREGWDTAALCQQGDASTIAKAEDLWLEPVAATDLTRLYARLRGSGPGTASPAGSPSPVSKPTGLSSKLNRWLMFPDKQMTWRGPAVRHGRELLAREKFDLIFASLEPRTSLLVAARLSRETGIPCAFEYRDLWTGNPAYHLAQPTALHRRLHLRLERRTLRQARRVSAVSRGIADYLTATHGSVLRAPVELNYNFFDPQEYPPAPLADAPGRPLTLYYAGALYGQRSPRLFFEGLRLFLDRNQLTPRQFRFQWAGPISGIDGLPEMLDRNALRPYVDFLGQIPHREALGRLVGSDAALLIQAPNDSVHVPGKLFEALGARVPIFALSHPCEVTEIIGRCEAGIVVAHDPPAIADGLEKLRGRLGSGTPWQFNDREVEQFSATACVRKLAAFLQEALA